MNPGVQIALLVCLAVMVIIVGLLVYTKLHPTTTLGKDVNAAVDRGMTWEKTAESELQSAVPTMRRWETQARDELAELLDAAVEKLTSTSTEDDAITKAKAKIVQHEAEKAHKLDLIRAHIAKLQAHVAANTAA